MDLTSPSTCSQPLPALLSAVADALRPWLPPLSARKPPPLPPPPPRAPRALRALHAALSRLAVALDTSDAPLFETAAERDVAAALRELREIALRARHRRAPRPRIRVDRAQRAYAAARGPPPPPPLLAPERRRLACVANRVDTLVQIALWKRRVAVSLPRSIAPTPPRPTRTRSPPAVVTSRTAELQRRPWYFSLVESPITPLRTRNLLSARDGEPTLAMWRSRRVSVRLMRSGYVRFVREADYRYALGQSVNIPSLCGAHWEPTASSPRATSNNCVGYIVMRVCSGSSLDHLVRQCKIPDTVTHLRVLQRVVAALLFAQRVHPSITHQDLHPGNVLLIPPAPPPPPSPPVPEPVSPVTSAHLAAHRTPLSSPVVRAASLPRPDHADVADPLHHRPHHSQLAARSLSHQQPSQPTAAANPSLAAQTYIPTSNVTTRSSPSNHSDLPAVCMDDALQRDNVASFCSSTSADSVPASHLFVPYAVQVVDFPQAHEAHGMRTESSWNCNPLLSGYCAPEKVTPSMWSSVAHQIEKRNRRDYERERRIMPSSPSAITNGRHSPRPQTPTISAVARRRSSSNIAANAVIAMPPSRSNSGSQRQQFDNETYALFGDDHLNPELNAHHSDHSAVMDVRAPTPLHSAAHLVPNGAVAHRLTTAQSVVEQSLRTAQHAIDNNNKEVGHRRRRLPTFSSDDIVGLARRRRSSDLSHLEAEALPSENRSLTKIDVWSVGWIMYYMATGKHPPNDAWARANIADELDWSAVPLECRPIIRMCIQTDKEERASLREVKRKVDSTLQALMFAKGLALLESEKRAAFMLLDKAVGIKSVDGALRNSTSATAMKPPTSPASATTPFHDNSEPSTFVRDAELQPLTELEDGVDDDDEEGPHKVLGLNDKTRFALAALPLCVVRRVEWEAAAHYLRRSDEEIKALRSALMTEKWNKNDVKNGTAAIDYLKKRSIEGVSSAQSALGWVYRWGAGGTLKNVSAAMREWEKAVAASGDPEACNGLGLLYHHGRNDIGVDGGRARYYYQIAVDQGYPPAAVNLGVMLHDGAAGLEPDGVAARGLYEIASRHGDAIAANNLGLLLRHGAPGVEVDAPAAVRAYELAIERQERHHACRNLAELLWEGAPGVPPSRANAVEYFGMAISRGDAASKKSACSALRQLLQTSLKNREHISSALIDKCSRLLGEGRGN